MQHILQHTHQCNKLHAKIKGAHNHHFREKRKPFVSHLLARELCLFFFILSLELSGVLVSVQEMKVTLNDANTTSNNTSTLISSSYEPKSVLDLRRSPSPVVEKQVLNAIEVDPFHRLEKEDFSLNVNQQYFEDWDSLMRELGLNDDDSNITPESKPFIDHHHQLHDSQDVNDHHHITTTANLVDLQHATTTSFDSADNLNLLCDIPTTYNTSDQSCLTGHLDNNNWDVGFDYVDELIRLAECFETNSLQLGQVILARLNQRLTSPSGKPLQRACFYFKEALQSLLTGSTPVFQSSSDTIVQTIKAQKTFSNVSPIPMFSSFTANQTVLEALENGFTKVHVVDFDIGLGGQWASFIKELADSSARAAPPSMRVSAVVPQDCAVQSRLVRENITQFARELNIRFDIDILPLPTFEYLSFKGIKFMEGEKVIVLLSPSICHQIGTGFLNDLRHVAPHLVVHVDYCDIGTGPTASYRQTVINGLEYYSTLLESIEAGANSTSTGDNWVTRIEMFAVYPKIVEVVVAGRSVTAAREGLVAAGLRQVGLSKFAEFQAECLVRRAQIRGFHVVKRQGEMLLCWHDRPLAAASAWTYW